MIKKATKSIIILPFLLIFACNSGQNNPIKDINKIAISPTKEFSGTWCGNLENTGNDRWHIEIDKNQKKGTSFLEVMSNQLNYSCSNELQGDTLFFYFQSVDAGMGGSNWINKGVIEIPKKGKLIGKAIIISGKLIFFYKTKNMDLGDTYNQASE